MKMITKSSPNWNHRPIGVPVDTVVLHATADDDTQASIAWCLTPAPKNPKPVSYHDIIDRDGTVTILVPADKRAWHAGYSEFLGRTNVNNFSVGLSFANRNDGIEPYPDVQLNVGAALVAGYMKRFPAITIDRITTHAVIRAAWRVRHPDAEVKTDPAPPAFDLAAFKVRVLRELARPKDAA